MNIYYTFLLSYIISMPSNTLGRIMQLMYHDKSIATFSLWNDDYDLCQYVGNGQCAALIETSAHVSNAQVCIKWDIHINNSCSVYRKTRTESYCTTGLQYWSNCSVFKFRLCLYNYFFDLLLSANWFSPVSVGTIQESLPALDRILQLWAKVYIICLWSYVS